MYYVPRPVADADLALMRRLDAVHLDFPYAGARLPRRLLRREGVAVGRRHLGTLMRRMAITLDSSFCVDAVEDAIAKYGCPAIFDTDQGAQFTSAAFTGLLQDHGIAISMDGHGCWRDNILVEWLWRSIKYEEVYLHAYASVSEAKAGIGGIFSSTTRPDRTPASPTRRPMKPTSPRCHFGPRPNARRSN